MFSDNFLLFIMQIPLPASAELHRSNCFTTMPCNFCLDSILLIATRGQVSPGTTSILKIQRSREKIQTEYGSNQRTSL